LRRIWKIYKMLNLFLKQLDENKFISKKYA